MNHVLHQDAPVDAFTTVPGSPPLVSVVLTTRNRERYVGASLESLAAQTYPELEIIAVDDGSSDGTRSILEAFASTRPQVRLMHTRGIGPAAARDQAFRVARGDLFALQDDDDLSRPERIERQVRYMLAHPEIGVLGTSTEIIDERGEFLGLFPVPLDPSEIRAKLPRRPPFVHGSILMRRQIYFAAGGYRAAFPVVEDFDLYLRIPDGAGLANLPEPLYAWRHHPDNTLSRLESDQFLFVAIARAFASERRDTGRDSAASLEHLKDPERFLAEYRHAGRLLAYLGEGYARAGRGSRAFHTLARALTRPGARARSLGWLAVAPGVALAWQVRRAIKKRLLAKWEPGL